MHDASELRILMLWPRLFALLFVGCAHATPLPLELRNRLLTCPAKRQLVDAEAGLALAGYSIAARGPTFVQTDFRPAPVRIGRGVTHQGSMRVTAARTSSVAPIRLRFDGRAMQVAVAMFTAGVAVAAPVGGDVFEIEPTDAQWRDEDVQEALQSAREAACGTREPIELPEAKKRR